LVAGRLPHAGVEEGKAEVGPYDLGPGDFYVYFWARDDDSIPEIRHYYDWGRILELEGLPLDVGQAVVADPRCWLA